jgi:DNA-binding NtrC family response regulator
MLSVTHESLSGMTGKHIRTILVVEDEELIRMVLTNFLHDSGYNVLEAGDVAQAKDLLASQRVDLVFSDINMPGTETGFDLQNWICRHHPGTKVLLTSGRPHAEEATKGSREPLIPKPYRCSAVLQRIQDLF